MTPRERVLAAIHHKEADRVPIDLGSHPSSGISAVAYSNLRKHLGLTTGHTRIFDVVQQLAEPEEQILDLFGVDVLDVGRVFNDNDDKWYDIALQTGEPAQYPVWFHPQKNGDAWEVFSDKQIKIARMPNGATFFDQTIFPWEQSYPENMSGLSEAMNMVLWSRLVHSPWDHAGDENFWKTLREKTILLRGKTDRALVITVGCNLFEWGTFLRRMDNFLMDLVLDESNVEKLIEALMEKHLQTLKKVIEAVGDTVDIIRFGDDLGMDSGPFMGPDTYRVLFKKHHQKLNEYVHSHSKMHTLLHSCGSISRLLPDIIEAGFEIINPVQTNSVEMDALYLKKEFGKDLTFWGGGADTRNIINRGTPADVVTHVKERIKIFSTGGGFVFNPIHNIMPDVPPENIIAMFKTVKEFKL